MSSWTNFTAGTNTSKQPICNVSRSNQLRINPKAERPISHNQHLRAHEGSPGPAPEMIMKLNGWLAEFLAAAAKQAVAWTSFASIRTSPALIKNLMSEVNCGSQDVSSTHLGHRIRLLDMA